MSDLLEQVATYLSGKSIGRYSKTGTDGTIFLEMLPEDLNDCIGIYARGGGAGDVNNEITEANVQCIVRGANKLNTLDLGYSIVNNICGFNSQPLILGGYRVIDIQAPQGVPVYLGTDNSGRHEYSINLMVEFEQ